MSKNRRRKRKQRKKIANLERDLGIVISKGKRCFLHKVSIDLNKNKPKSEVWFENQCKHSKMPLHLFLSNRPFLGYIPDYRSDKLRLIIEIDGDIHKLHKIKEKDRMKDELYKKAGYTVVRIIAYNENSLKAGFSKIRDILSKPKH